MNLPYLDSTKKKKKKKKHLMSFYLWRLIQNQPVTMAIFFYQSKRESIVISTMPEPEMLLPQPQKENKKWKTAVLPRKPLLLFHHIVRKPEQCCGVNCIHNFPYLKC